MGYAKELQLEEFERGWSLTTQSVCTHCVNDYALEEAIHETERDDRQCDFCGRSPAGTVDALVGAFMAGLKNEYGDADDEGVSWESAEGGYQWGRTWDTGDLVDNFIEILVGPGPFEAVASAIHGRTWVERNFAQPRRDEALSAAWRRFCEAVRYETRYVFWLRHDEDVQELRFTGEVPASQILDELGALIEDLHLPTSDDDFGPPESPELFSLGIMGGGMTPQNELVADALIALMRTVRDQRHRYPNAGLRVNLVFHTPGPISKPGFEGVYVARFARKTSHILVNVAVPETLTFDQVPHFFTAVLRETIAVVLEYVKKRKLAIDTTNVRAMIDDLVAKSAGR